MENRLIYAVDDESAIREVYKYALESAGFEVEAFCGAEDLFVATEKKPPDLFILDIMLDGLDGYAILENLRQNESTSEIPVIMVSAKTTEIDKVKGLNLGADDYIAKPFGVLELIARVNAKLRRTPTQKRSPLKLGNVLVDDEKHTVTADGKSVALTLKQYELLKVLMKNAGTVVKRDELLDKVWGENYGETRTLDIHIGELRKLFSNSDIEISTIRGVGYILNEKQDSTF